MSTFSLSLIIATKPKTTYRFLMVAMMLFYTQHDLKKVAHFSTIHFHIKVQNM